MKCQIHNKDLKENAKGYYCATPIKKDAQGQVLEWCSTKIGKTVSTDYQPKVSNQQILDVVLEIRDIVTQYFHSGTVSMPKTDNVDKYNSEIQAEVEKNLAKRPF